MSMYKKTLQLMAWSLASCVLFMMYGSYCAGVSSSCASICGGFALDSAIQRGSTQELKRLLVAELDPDQEDAFGSRPLVQAAFEGDEQMVKLLLDAGSSPNQLNKWGESALLLAAKKGYWSIVEQLLKAGAQTGEALEKLSDPEQALVKKYEHIVEERKKALKQSLDGQANQQTGYSTGGHGFPAVLRELVEEFEGTRSR